MLSSPRAACFALQRRVNCAKMRQLPAVVSIRTHMGHSHGHGHDASSVTWWSIWANLGLAATKGVAGVLGNSTALVSDAVHSVTDLIASGTTLWAVKAAQMPKDDEHPYGHGRFETLGAVAVSGILVATGVGIGMHSAELLSNPNLDAPTNLALGVAALSVAVQEVTYQVTIKTANDLNSEVLRANAWHHRADALSSVLAVVGIAGSQLGMAVADPLAGVAVAALIIKAGAESGWRSIRELSDDTTSERGTIKSIEKIIPTVEGVLGFNDLRSRRLGPYSIVDVRIEVPPFLSVSAGHEAAERVRARIMETHPDVREVLVHVDPAGAHCSNAEEYQLSRPAVEVEEEVRLLVEARKDIVGVSHLVTHHLGGKNSVLLTMEIEVDDHKTVGEASKIARDIRTQVLAAVRDVSDVDIHLEIHDGSLHPREPGASSGSPVHVGDGGAVDGGKEGGNGDKPHHH